MKKTNRFIALLTALVLVFSTLIGTTAFAAVNSDVVGTDFAEAVGKLKAVGVMEGYPDGTFLPNGEITRAEFAKIAVMAYGLGDAAEASKGTTKFADVASSHWAAGYINLAASRSLITGYPDGTFKPDGKITNAEAITILCRLVGLGPVIDKEGTWPANYVGRAANEGILKGTNVASTTNATRGLVAKMLVNTLTVDMWGANGYGDDGSVDYGKLFNDDRDEYETLLEDKLEITETEDAQVDDYDVDDNSLTISGLGTVDVADGVDVNLYDAYLNEVTVWQNDDDEVIFIDVTTDYYIDAIEFNEDGDELTLIGADKDLDLDLVDAELNRGAIDTTDKTYDLAKVVLDDDGDVAYVDAYTFDEFIVVKSVDDDVVTDLEDEELDLEDYEIYKDGMLVTAADIEEGDILLINDGVMDGVAEVFTKSVTGTIENVFDDAFEVDNTEYDFDAGLVADAETKYINEDGDYDKFDSDAAEAMEDEGDVTIFVDREGEALYVTGELGAIDTNDVVGVLSSDVTRDTTFGKSYLEFEFVNELGKNVTETVKIEDLDIITVDGVDYEVGEDAPDGVTTDSEIDKLTMFDDAATPAVQDVIFAKNDAGQVIEDASGDIEIIDFSDLDENEVVVFTYDADGDVTGLEFFDTNTVALTTTFDTSDENYAKGKKLVSSSLIFDITDGVDEDDTVITAWDDVDFDILTSGAVEQVYFNTDNEVVAIVSDATDVDDDTTDFVGLLISFRENTDGDVTRLEAWVDGVEKTYTVDEETSSLTTGVAYTLVVNDEDGIVDDVITLNDADVDVDRQIDSLTVTSVDISDKEFIVSGDTTAYKLVSGATIIDITDGEDEGEELAVRELGDLGAANDITIILDEANTHFVKMVIVRDNDQ